MTSHIPFKRTVNVLNQQVKIKYPHTTKILTCVLFIFFLYRGLLMMRLHINDVSTRLLPRVTTHAISRKLGTGAHARSFVWLVGGSLISCNLSCCWDSQWANNKAWGETWTTLTYLSRVSTLNRTDSSFSHRTQLVNRKWQNNRICYCVNNSEVS